MGLFSRSPSVTESFGYAVQAFAIGFSKLDGDVRKRIAPEALSAIKGYIGNQSFSEQHKFSYLDIFKIISGTVGVTPSAPLDTYGRAGVVSEIIESTLPCNTPLIVLGPIRMVIEEYITGKSMSEIDYEKFDKSDARELVNALMVAIEIVNTRCVQEPKKHSVNEVMCLAFLAAVVAVYAKERLPYLQN